MLSMQFQDISNSTLGVDTITTAIQSDVGTATAGRRDRSSMGVPIGEATGGAGAGAGAEIASWTIDGLIDAKAHARREIETVKIVGLNTKSTRSEDGTGHAVRHSDDTRRDSLYHKRLTVLAPFAITVSNALAEIFTLSSPFLCLSAVSRRVGRSGRPLHGSQGAVRVAGRGVEGSDRGEAARMLTNSTGTEIWVKGVALRHGNCGR